MDVCSVWWCNDCWQCKVRRISIQKVSQGYYRCPFFQYSRTKRFKSNFFLCTSYRFKTQRRYTLLHRNTIPSHNERETNAASDDFDDCEWWMVTQARAMAGRERAVSAVWVYYECSCYYHRKSSHQLCPNDATMMTEEMRWWLFSLEPPFPPALVPPSIRMKYCITLARL